MKKCLKRFLSTMLAASVLFCSGVFDNLPEANHIFYNNVEAASITINEASGWLESAYAEWAPVSGTSQYVAYYKKSGTSNYVQLDDQLVRKYNGYWRADAVGLAAGTYTLKIEAYNSSGTVIASAETSSLTVQAYDRSGAAFSSKSTFKTGSGAYNDDGTLKSGAQVIYVTKDNAKTVSADIITDAKGTLTTFTGFQQIIYGLQKGYDKRGIAIRIIGTIDAANCDTFLSSAEGIQVKGKNSYSEMNLTIEGIGEDAAVRGFGFLVRNSGNVEFRNFAIMLCMDDALSLDTDNCNVWIHNMDFFYGGTGGDADQAKGDGTTDVKADSTFVTISYNHYWDNGKSSLCGMKSESTSSHITYHHNWFDHSDSRHPRIRTMSVHIYNNYFDSNAKYGVGVTMGSSAFVESNYFKDCNDVMMSSGQGTDATGAGTFSGETGGIIKSYNNSYNGTYKYIPYSGSNDCDAYEVSSRTETVPSSITTIDGGTSYNNFDTSSSFDLAVNTAITPVADVPTVVTKYAGRINGGDFPGANKSSYTGMTDAKSYAVDTAFKSAITSYSSPVVAVGGSSDGSVIVTQTTTESTTSSATEATTESTTASQGGDQPTETTTEQVDEPVIDESAYVHNFTTDGKTSSFYKINGNLSTNYGTVTYNSLTLTQCLKMESSTYIDFSLETDGTLYVVTNPTYKGAILLDDEQITIGSDGVATLSITGGTTHELSKGGSNYIFYLAFVPNGGSDTPDPTPTVVMGDANDDGTVDVNDVNMILDYLVKKIQAVTNADAADVDADSSVTIKDANKVKKYVKGEITGF